MRYEIAGCPACLEQRHAVLAGEDQLKRELESLWQFHLRRLKAGAPIAQLFDRTIFSQRPPLQLVNCVQCGTVFRNPREQADELIDTYAEEEPASQALDSLFEQQRNFYRTRAARLTETLGRSGSVLEVGSYLGAFLWEAAHVGWQAEGIDVNTHAAAYARERGCVVHETTLEGFPATRRFDAVAIWNCFDQLPDPRATLERARALLAPNGVLALRVPNGAFYRRVRRLPHVVRDELLAWNNLASFPYRYGFTAGAMETMLADFGFRDVRTRGDVLVTISGPWTRRWARAEEALVKRLLRMMARRSFLPWLELYARAS